MQIGKEMAIPSILKIGNGALGKIGGYLKTEGLDLVVLYFGNGLIDMFGELVMNSLKEADVNVLEYNELDTVDIDDIITLAFARMCFCSPERLPRMWRMVRLVLPEKRS